MEQSIENLNAISVQEKNNHYSLYFIVAVILLLVASFFVYRSVVYKTQISEFDVKASISDIAGVSQNSHFILKTTAPLSTQVLEKYIKIIPETVFSVKKVSALENTFEIIPKEELKSEQIYVIKVDKGPLASRDFSWAYQVKAPFQVVSSIPSDKGVDVPVNTGIEIYFNRDDIIDPEKSIEITPEVKGRFAISENKISFIPNNPLADRTIYTVKIKTGIKAKDSDDIFVEDKIIQFQTSLAYSNKNPSVYFYRQFSEFKPESSIVLGLNAYNTESVSANVYKFGTSEELLDSLEKIKGDTPWARYYTNIETQIPDNKKVFSGDLPLETHDYSSLLRLPQSLQNGYYAVVISSGESKDISWFQVNSAASFAAFSSLKSLVWLKDIKDEKNINGIPIIFSNKQIGKTNADGVALFDTPQELIKKSNDSYYKRNNDRKFFVAKISTGDLIIPIENEYGYSTLLDQNDKWWDYISLNKNIYLPTDIIRFWAIQKPRSGENSGEDISIKLSTPFWSEDQKDIITYAETKLKLSDYNTVTGELSFANIKPGIYELTFRKGEEILGKKTVTVSAYIKPAYKITLTPNKDKIFAGDTVTFKVKAEFFDKTPVANTMLSYYAYGGGYGINFDGKLTLNSQGEGSFTVTPKYESDQNYWPSYLSVNIRPIKAEEGQIETNSSVFVFGPNINNSIEQKQSNTDITFSIKTRAVVLGSSSRGEPYWNTEDYLGDPVIGVNTKVEISEVVYLKNKTGAGYDPINKLTYPIYDYKTEENFLSSEMITSDQNGLSKFSFSPENKKTYKFVFTAYDSIGRIVKDTRYIYGGLNDSDYSSSDYYLYNSDNNKSYKIGEQINLQLQTQQGAVPLEGKGNYIFMTVNNGNIEYKIQDSPKYNATFQNKDIPNVGIWPGWFSGGRFHNSYLQNISFDANERRLNIMITKDKQTYKPGDNVSLGIKVTDKNNNPVKAEINLSALDEAVFSISPDENDIVNDLYKDIYSQVVIRTSNMPPYGGGGAEKGGGGGDGARSNIQEMAIFKSIMSDSNGNAHVEFKLPDNITSWRLTSQAVTKDLFSGKNISFIPVTLPLFVDATLNNTYLAGDELTLRLRAFGTAIKDGDVNFTIESQTLPFKKIEKTGINNTEVSLGSLVSGIHQLTLRVSNGTLTDTLIRPLKVLNSYFTKNTSIFYDGVFGLKINNDSTSYTSVTFSQRDRGLLYNQLKSLSYQYGVRVDQKGTELIVANLLNKYFNEKNEIPNFQATKYQSNTGGIQLLPYSSDDLELSAISAHLFDNSEFDSYSLKNYLQNSLSDKKSDISRISLTLYGLTAFNEPKLPVLTKIESIKNNRNLTIKDKIFIALALDSVGAKEEARAYYRKLIKPSIEIKSSYAYINGLKGDDTITTTALVSALTASIEEPEASLLALYVEQNKPKETLNNFQNLLYVKSALSKLALEDINFTYRLGTKEYNKTLNNGETFTLTLSPQELLSFELLKSKGKVGVVATYEQQTSPNKIIKDSNLSLSRNYEINNNSSNSFKEGDLIKVILTPNFTFNSLDGSYQIVDYLPSGLRPLSQEYNSYYGNGSERVYPAEINDQKVTFIVGKNITLPVYYYARVVSKGVYKAEPAMLQSLNSLESMTISNEDSIIVK